MDNTDVVPFTSTKFHFSFLAISMGWGKESDDPLSSITNRLATNWADICSDKTMSMFTNIYSSVEGKVEDTFRCDVI